MTIRIAFMGTPEFALPTLKTLIERSDCEVVGVVTQPDRPAGRGRRIVKSPVKLLAESQAIPLLQPANLRDTFTIELLQSWSPDVIVVVAFGQILRQQVLELPPHGCLNVHASLLPRWRGAAPVQHALLAGDHETGVTIMKMDAGIDTGPILAQRAIAIGQSETFLTLSQKLAELGAEMLTSVLREYVDGMITAVPQSEVGVTYAPLLKKTDGRLDWTASAINIDRKVRALNPWPGAYAQLDDLPMRILRGSIRSAITEPSIPGQIIVYEGALAVLTGDAIYALEEIQPANKQKMSGRSFVIGHPDLIGKVFQSS